MASYLETGCDIAREAGAILTKYYEQRVGFELKGEFDLVTVADRTSEKLVVERLRAHFPSHGIVAEEGGGHSSPSEYCWFVDPLDGTTNFAHGFPAFCVSMALERAGERIAGIIFDPLRQELFATELGAGASLNGTRIEVSKADRLQDCLVATGFPSYKRHKSVNVHYYHQLAMVTHGVRRAGSAALDLAYVACGRLDAFWEFGLKPWDMAAGMLLITEAGGTVSDMNGAPSRLDSPHVLGDNTIVHAEMLKIFSEVSAGKYRVPLPQVNG